MALVMMASQCGRRFNNSGRPLRRFRHFGRGDAASILGVSDCASVAEIKQAFRKLALMHHPDVGGSDVARYQEAQEAMEYMLRNRRNAKHHSPQDDHSEHERADYERARAEEAERTRWSEEDRQNALRGFRILCAYVAIGTIVKCALLNATDYARGSQWAAGWVHTYPRQRCEDRKHLEKDLPPRSREGVPGARQHKDS